MLPNDRTAALVVRARNGEAEAFEVLARTFLRAAYVVALGIVRRVADAEDVAQDAMVIAFERLETCREPDRFGAWLLQITRNQARNWLERRRLRDVPADDGLGTQEGAGAFAEPLLRRRLLDALATLGDPQREVVLLHDLEGWTHPEIGAALGFSEVMSRQHLFQARRALRERLGGSDETGAERRRVVPLEDAKP